MRYFIHLAYSGKNYHGWQRQTNVLGIQDVIEEKLSLLLGKPVFIHGCGRTDAGVHAHQYFFQLEIEESWDFDFVFRINKMLPPDIAVFEIIPVTENANAQHDAIRRTYDYYLHFKKTPFLADHSTWYEGFELTQLEKMAKGANILTQYNDFRALCKRPDKVGHTRCNLSAVNIYKNKNGDRLRIEVTSNRFLRGMIRLIVTKLLEIGQGRLSLEDWENFIARNENPSFKRFAPPQGLHLSKIEYPFLNITPKREIGEWVKVVCS